MLGLCRAAATGLRVRMTSVGVAADQRRHLGIVHPCTYKGAGRQLGGVAVMHGTKRVVRPPNQGTAGKFLLQSKFGSKQFVATKTFAQYAENPQYRLHKDKFPRLLGQEYQKAILNKLIIQKPRRPNSGKVLCCMASFRRPSIYTGEPVLTQLMAHIGDKSAPLREYSVIQFGGKHKRGLRVKYFVRRGKYDFPAKPNAGKQGRKYEAKIGY